MTRPVRPTPATSRRNSSIPNTLISSAILIAALYFGRDVFVPLALAVLLSFVLAPLADLVQRLGVGRVPSVLFVVILAFAGLFSLFGYVGTQVAQFAAELPSYQSTIQDKIRTLRGMTGGGGTLEQAGKVLQKLNDELNKDPIDKPEGAQAQLSPIAEGKPKPIPVEVHQPPSSTLETLQGIASPLLHPLAMIGFVVIFVIFILLQRDDLRDRLIRLSGSHDLQRTTAAIDDAAKSLSRYFLTQLAVNAAFGVAVGLGLTVIGLPNPLLWGTLAAGLRFIPYVGALIAAVLPILVAAAVDPGWSLALWTAGLILGLELLVGQVIEPLVYGHSSGISPLAVVISATLWTALWGPVGLLIATPLTICLVVLGRHVDHLEFLDVILGDRPPLTPAQNFYQRLLARDPEEAAAQAEIFMKDRSLGDYYDDVALKGLALAQKDLTRGLLDPANVLEMKSSIETLADDLSDHEDKPIPHDSSGDVGQAIPETPAEESPSKLDDKISDQLRSDNLVLCVGGRSALDDAASLLFAQLLVRRTGLETRMVESDSLTVAAVAGLEPKGVALICVSYLDVSSPAHLRFVVRRLRRRFPEARVLIGCWGKDPATTEELVKAAKGDLSATSFQIAVDLSVHALVADDAVAEAR